MAFARLFFPSEAKLAMVVAQSETTSEIAGISPSKGSSGNLMEVDLNETPTVQKKRLHSRLESLMKTGNYILLVSEYTYKCFSTTWYFICSSLLMPAKKIF